MVIYFEAHVYNKEQFSHWQIGHSGPKDWAGVEQREREAEKGESEREEWGKLVSILQENVTWFTLRFSLSFSHTLFTLAVCISIILSSF